MADILLEGGRCVVVHGCVWGDLRDPGHGGGAAGWWGEQIYNQGKTGVIQASREETESCAITLYYSSPLSIAYKLPKNSAATSGRP